MKVQQRSEDPVPWRAAGEVKYLKYPDKRLSTLSIRAHLADWVPSCHDNVLRGPVEVKAEVQ